MNMHANMYVLFNTNTSNNNNNNSNKNNNNNNNGAEKLTQQESPFVQLNSLQTAETRTHKARTRTRAFEQLALYLHVQLIL